MAYCQWGNNTIVPFSSPGDRDMFSRCEQTPGGGLFDETSLTQLSFGTFRFFARFSGLRQLSTHLFSSMSFMKLAHRRDVTWRAGFEPFLLSTRCPSCPSRSFERRGGDFDLTSSTLPSWINRITCQSKVAQSQNLQVGALIVGFV